MQDNQPIDKFQAMQLAATLLAARSDTQSDNEIAERILNLAEIIREKDRERVRARLGNSRLHDVKQ